MTLRGWSIGELARAGELHRPNLVSWLGGKPQVMAEARQLKACETLGWHYGRLRRDVIHCWEVGNDFSLLKTVLLRDGLQDLGQLEVRPAYGPGSGMTGGAILVSRDDLQNPLIVLLKRKLGTSDLELIGASTLGFGVFNECPYLVDERESELWWKGEPVASGHYQARDFLQDTRGQWVMGMSSLEGPQLVLLMPMQRRWLELLEKRKLRYGFTTEEEEWMAAFVPPEEA